MKENTHIPHFDDEGRQSHGMSWRLIGLLGALGITFAVSDGAYKGRHQSELMAGKEVPYYLNGGHHKK